MNTRRRGSNRKMRGGMSAQIKDIIDKTEVGEPNIINPNSNVVVVTYWWGRGNFNKNINDLCRDDVLEIINLDIAVEEVPGFKDLHQKFKLLKKGDRSLPEFIQTRKEHTTILQDRFRNPDIRKRLIEREAEKRKELIDEGEMSPEKKFEEMIAEWEGNMKQMNCNYLTTEYDIPRNLYQEGINAKPYFIQKCLAKFGGRSVLYIDGDMKILKVPALFELKNVDFMARGWNCDPRANIAYLETPSSVCVDPWRFETSGGTMFFANTKRSNELLNVWISESARPEYAGKADDRILSMIVTQQRFALKSNIIQLPIEYLWLDRDYNEFQEDSEFAKLSDAVISHPACLTSEDSAREQGASSNRDPPGYDDIYDDEECLDGGIFYAYIMCEGNEALVDTMKPYFNFLKNYKKENSTDNYFRFVDFSEKYGTFTQTAEQNLSQAEQLMTTYSGQTDIAILPATATIPEILARLKNGQSVTIGGKPCRPADDEVECILTRTPPPVRKNNKGAEIDEIDIRYLIVDMNAPMYFSSNSKILPHLLAMCSTLSDLNSHIRNNYWFHSRIRWQVSDVAPPQTGSRRKTHKRKTNSKSRMYKSY